MSRMSKEFAIYLTTLISQDSEKRGKPMPSMYWETMEDLIKRNEYEGVEKSLKKLFEKEKV